MRGWRVRRALERSTNSPFKASAPSPQRGPFSSPSDQRASPSYPGDIQEACVPCRERGREGSCRTFLLGRLELARHHGSLAPGTQGLRCGRIAQGQGWSGQRCWDFFGKPEDADFLQSQPRTCPFQSCLRAPATALRMLMGKAWFILAVRMGTPTPRPHQG